MAIPISDPIQPLGLVGPTLQPVPVIEQATEDAGGAKPIDLLAREKIGGFPDPFAGFQDAPESFDQFQDASTGPDAFSEFATADDLDARTVEDLDADREKFHPAAYFRSNPDAARDPAKLKKLLDVYRKRREEGLTAKGVVKAAVSETPGIVGGIAKGALKLVENGIDVVVQPIFNAVVGTFSGDMLDPQKRKELFKGPRKSLAEISAGSEAAGTGLVDLTRQGLRKLREPTAEMAKGVFTGKKVSRIEQTDQELLAELSADSEFQRNAEDILQGGGEAAKNFKLDAETLAKDGITIDPQAVEALSLVDPVSLVATGGAFKLVGVAGKVIGTARTLEGAEKLAARLGDLSKTVAGKTISGVGKAASSVGKKGGGLGIGLGTITGVSVGTSGAGIIPAIAAGTAGKLIGPGLRRVGPLLTQAGEIVAGKAPEAVSVGAQRIASLVQTGAGAVKTVGGGAARGAVASAPFVAASDEDTTAGALLGAGVALGAGHAVGAKGLAVVKDATALRYFGESRPTLPEVPSPGYGTPTDAIHESNLPKLSVQDASELNHFREAVRPQGGEIYAVDRGTFRQKVSDVTGVTDPAVLDVYEGHQAFFDETQGDKKIVYLNADTPQGTRGGLIHDAGHIFDALLSEETRAKLRSAVKESFTPEQLAERKKSYETRVGSKIGEKAAIDEFIAENFSALFNAVPLTELAAPRGLLNKFIDVIAEGAESLGVDFKAKTPTLDNPTTIGLQNLFRRAAGDVIEKTEAGRARRAYDAANPPPADVIPFPGDEPPPSSGGVVAPQPTPPPTGPAPASVAPPPNVITLPPARPIRTTPEAPKTPEARAAAAKRFEVTGIGPAKELAAKLADPVGIKAVEDISAQMESGNPVLEVEHLGISSEGTPATPEGRTSRRATQAAAYEVLKGELSRVGAPEDLVARHLKTFVPVRWEPQGGSPTLIAMSVDKVLTNLGEIAKDPKAKDLIPYPTEAAGIDPKTGKPINKLTPEGWREAVSDFQKYAENQANGRKGDGGRLEVPEAGELSIPVENPSYTPQPLSPERSDFANLIQGLGTPETARKGQKGKTPGNIKGQLLAEANRRPVELPANIPTKQAGKQAFVDFPPRVVQEVNPLRNRMKEAGVNTSVLHEVTERIRAQDIEKVTPRPDLAFQAPVTDIIRGGFLPAPTEFRQKNLGGRTVEEFSDYILKASPEEWKAATDNMTGGLTGGAWNLGLGLTERADVARLKSFADKFADSARTAMKAGDFDSAYSLISRGQFFREAYEASTGTGSAGAAFKRGTAGMESAKPPFPIAEKTQGTATGGDTTTVNVGEGGQFLPAEQLEVGTATEPELRIVPRSAAAGGTPPIEPPGSLRPPPVAAGFLPAEELAPEEAAPELRVVTPAAAGGTPPIEPPGFRPPPVAVSVAQKEEETPRFLPEPDEKIQNLAKSYATDAGLPYAPKGGYAEVKPDLAKKLANFYEQAKSDPTNPEVAASYDALIRETEEQGKSILAAGYKIEPWTGAGEPYKSSAEAIADVRDNKHLYFRKTSESFGSGESNVGNPMLRESNLVPGQSANDVFRWVHDFFGHSKEGFQFGPRGEFNAWRAHSEMYSPEAQGALASETLAQNSWVNYGPHLEGKNIPQKDRPFAEQKNLVVPKELIDEASFLPRTEAGRKLEKRGYEIVPSGEMGIRRVSVVKDGNEFAVIQSVQRSPQRAEISMVQKYKGAPKGIGEVLYRELGSQLQADGVKLVEGQVIAPEPLAIRRKVFGEFKSLDVNTEPATYAEALATAERVQSRTGGAIDVIEPVNEITSATRFLPGKRDAQGRPLNKDGEIDYAKWQKEGVAARKKREAELIAKSVPKGPVTEDLGTATGWVLPDQEFVPLDAAFHEQYLADNAADLNSKFKTKFSKTPSVDDRLDALNAGFVRLRNQGGAMRVEANSERWPRLKSTVLNTLLDREGKFDSLTVSLLNKKGQQVDSASAPRLQELSGPEKFDAISEAVDSLRPGGAGFLPADEGLPGIGVQSVEEAGRAKAIRRIATVKKSNPEAVVPQYARNESGDIIVTADGTPKPLTLDYDFINSPVAKEAAKGLKGAAREEAAAAAIGEKLVDFYREAEKNPDLKAGSTWYSTARVRLKKVFGDDSKMFAELLGATSARTPVATNYRFALDAYNQFKAGAYDKTLAKYREGKSAWESGDVGDFDGETRGQFLDYWVRKHDLGVTQSSGMKFGMNSRAVLRVLDGSWASEVKGPKTPNFAGNLTGETYESTVDVWAARTLHRLANEGKKDRWRILPEMETGVKDADFYFGQAAYRAAAKKLGVKPDSVQSVLWFAEKRHWEERGWTRGAGAELSDFNVLLKETERAPSGELRMKTPQTGFDFGAEVSDIRRKR